MSHANFLLTIRWDSGYMLVYMKICALVILSVFLLTACDDKPPMQKLRKGITDGFYEQTGYEAKGVYLLRKEKNEYTGYVVLNDESKAWIEVYLDMDDPAKYMWKITEQSPTMLSNKYKKYQEELQKQFPGLNQ
jgi:hypothetical protein